MTRRTTLTFAAMSALAATSACSRTELSGPPEVRIGRDECAECGMMISEDRCSAAMLVDHGAGGREGGGRREHVLFDDVGCMLDYERGHAGHITPVDSFVHDHGTRAWVRAADAVFLHADREKLPTPMGSGMVAFAARTDARAMQQDVGGDLMDYATLAAARAARLRARTPDPAGNP